MISRPFKDIRLSRLGMGAMRLPSSDPKDRDAPIQYEEAFKVLHEAYNSGINYFDTAYVYNSGDSEKCLGEAMKGFDRNSWYVATKFNIDAEKDYKMVFEKSLERLQTDHIDFYLIHAVTDQNINEYINSGAIEYFAKKKEEGKITYYGFSAHASTNTLRRFVNLRDWDFGQLQLNYFDWRFDDTKEQYDLLTEKNIPVVVMEPVRGGVLADLPEEVMNLLRAEHPDWSAAKWAFQFVKSLDNVQVVLSGMSTVEQVKENVQTFSEEKNLTKKEIDLLMTAAERFKNKVQVPCTACRYCCAPCPQSINIPGFLKVYNNYKVDGPMALEDLKDVESQGRPADCLECGACMHHCPQNIEIPTLLEELAAVSA